MNKDDLFPILEIPEIPYPDSLVKGLKEIAKKIKIDLKNKKIDLDPGYFPINIEELEFPHNIQFSMFEWITESNFILQNLNIILSDFKLLAEQPKYFAGNPTRRLILLIRTYFYEIFRLREVFAVYLKKLKKYKYLNIKDVHEFKYIFGEHFNRAINIRNRMVHESFHWAGKNFDAMFLADGLQQIGKVLVKEDSSKISSLKEKIKDVYNEVIPSLLVEGHYVAEYLKNVVESFSQIVREIVQESQTNSSSRIKSDKLAF